MDCPEFARQQSNKIIMSQECISYIEASAHFPPVHRSYADMAKEISSLPAHSLSPISSAPVTLCKSYRKIVFQSLRPRAPLAKGSSSSSLNCQLSLFPSFLFLSIESRKRSIDCTNLNPCKHLSNR